MEISIPLFLWVFFSILPIALYFLFDCLIRPCWMVRDSVRRDANRIQIGSTISCFGILFAIISVFLKFNFS